MKNQILQTMVVLPLLLGLFLVGVDGCTESETIGIDVSAYPTSLSRATLGPRPEACIVAYWPGEESGEDLIGGHGGTLVGGVSFADGVFGRAFSFDGIDDEIHVSDDAAQSFSISSTESFTIEMWFYRTGEADRSQHVFGKRGNCSGGNSFNYQGFMTQSGLHIGAHGLSLSSGAGSIPIGEWVHYVGSYNGTTQNWKCYINGVFIGQGGGVPGPEIASLFYIGASGTCGGNYSGLIDEIYFYNCALTDEEVAEIYEADINPTVSLTIDIHPGSDVNPINLRSNGVIPVAVLTTDDFDATTIDPETARFGPGEAEESHGTGHQTDVDGDGDLDLVLHFRTRDAAIGCDAENATLTATTEGGESVTGTDLVTIVQCD